MCGLCIELRLYDHITISLYHHMHHITICIICTINMYNRGMDYSEYYAEYHPNKIQNTNTHDERSFIPKGTRGDLKMLHHWREIKKVEMCQPPFASAPPPLRSLPSRQRVQYYYRHNLQAFWCFVRKNKTNSPVGLVWPGRGGRSRLYLIRLRSSPN